MVDDRELWACAWHLFRLHGSAAWYAATLRAEALLDNGLIEGHEVFLQIRDRIAQLEAVPQTKNKH